MEVKTPATLDLIIVKVVKGKAKASSFANFVVSQDILLFIVIIVLIKHFSHLLRTKNFTFVANLVSPMSVQGTLS